MQFMAIYKINTWNDILLVTKKRGKKMYIKKINKNTIKASEHGHDVYITNVIKNKCYNKQNIKKYVNDIIRLIED